MLPAGDCVDASGGDVRAFAGSSGMINGVWLFELAIAPTQGRQGQTKLPCKSCSCDFKGDRDLPAQFPRLQGLSTSERVTTRFSPETLAPLPVSGYGHLEVNVPETMSQWYRVLGFCRVNV